MSKRMTVIALLLVAMAVPLAPIAKAHGGDDADVIIEWNQLLQTTMPASAGGLPVPASDVPRHAVCARARQLRGGLLEKEVMEADELKAIMGLAPQ
jgi:hypothetical protein